MEKLQLPMIHLNGSSAQSLEKEYSAAWDAVDKAKEALAKIDHNARDYYPISNEAFHTARQQRREQFSKLNGVLEYLEEHIIHIQCFK